MKQLYKAKNKPRNLKQSNSDTLGYGSGYGITPSFENGVGINCHVRILEKLGYKVIQSGNDSTTIFNSEEQMNKDLKNCIRIIESLCGDIELVSFGLAPNPNGFLL